MLALNAHFKLTARSSAAQISKFNYSEQTEVSFTKSFDAIIWILLYKYVQTWLTYFCASSSILA